MQTSEEKVKERYTLFEISFCYLFPENGSQLGIGSLLLSLPTHIEVRPQPLSRVPTFSALSQVPYILLSGGYRPVPIEEAKGLIRLGPFLRECLQNVASSG